MTDFINSIQQNLGQAFPGLIGALMFLVIGWIVALVLKAAVKKALQLIKINEITKTSMDIAGGVSKLVYYIIMLFVLLGVFNSLNLDIVSAPISDLLNQFLEFLPKLIAGIVPTIIVWLFARIAREVISGALGATGIDSKIGSPEKPMSQTLGNVVYAAVFLLFLPAILGVFEIEGLLKPAEGMIDKIFGFVPNIIAATLIGFVGWFIAKIVRDLISNLLAAAGADKVGEHVGLAGNFSISKLVGLVAYIFILLPAIVSSLKALEMEAVSTPASEMLSSILNTLPNIIAAGIILTITFLVARLVSGLMLKLLQGIGFNNIPEKLGFKLSGGKTPSEFVASTVVFFMMLFATVEASARLGFAEISRLVSFFIEFGGQVLLGTAIIAIGLWIANLVHASMSKAASSNSWSAGLVRVVIMGLVFAIGLRSMGVANDIINMAFGLTLGAAAVAVAISFGIGGREAAGRLAGTWVDKITK